ncbi:MAG TPA: IS1182 family transposase [Chloroflexota bacterium]|jgi:hypothetical protein
MLGWHAQRGFGDADTVYLDFVGRDSFYGYLASQRGLLFDDATFAEFYCLTNGRRSVAPSILATTLVLQFHDRVSDEEAVQRATFDLRWKVALGLELEQVPFVKSTLQEFRARLIANQEQQHIFKESLQAAKRAGFPTLHKKLKVALDTAAILGAAAVKDTFNLLGDGIVQLGRVLAKQAGERLGVWAEREGYGRYVTSSSLKGEAGINWDKPAERQRFLGQIVADADRLLEMARVARGRLAEGSPEDQALAGAAGLLSRILVQNIERKTVVEPPAGPAESALVEPPAPAESALVEPPAPAAAPTDIPEVTIVQGVAPDRVISVHDPEMRHGHKSASKRFNGFKTQIAADTDSQLIVAVAIIPGNAPDDELALEVIKQAEDTMGCTVETVVGDCAYGDGQTRQAFLDAGRTLIAKVPTSTNQGRFPKTDFTIDLSAGSCTCPAGHTTTDLRNASGAGKKFQFDPAVCAACPVRAQCVRGAGGRTIQVHPQELLLQAARAFQASPAFAEYRRRRQTAEHAIARLVQRGMRKARYCGSAKVLFQASMAAAVVNLTLVANASRHPGASATCMAAVLALLLLSVALRAQSDECGLPFVVHLPSTQVRSRPATTGSAGRKFKRFRPDS